MYDKDKLGKDETNGRLSIDARRICQLGGLTKIWDSLQDCKSGRLLWSAEFVEEADRQDDLTAETLPEKREEEVKTTVVSQEEEVKTASERKKDDNQETLLTVDNSSDLVSDKDDIKKSLEEALLESVNNDHQEKSEPVIEVIQESQELGFLGSMRAGFLRITVHRAENLVSKDFGGKSDPYVVIRYDNQKSKSKQVKKDLDPEFEFTTGYVVEEDGSHDLMIELKDHDDLGRNESLGYCRLDLRDMVSDGQNILKRWISLEGVEHGRLLVSVDLQGEGYNAGHEITENIDDEKKQDESEEENQLRQRKPVDHGQVRLNILYDENKEELKLFLHEAINLPGGHLADLPDPYCKVYLMPGKKKKKKSEVIKDDINPKFNEEFDFSIDMKDMKEGEMYLKLVIVDKKGVFTKSPILGAMQIHLDNPGLKNGIAGWFPLEQVDEDSE